MFDFTVWPSVTKRIVPHTYHSLMIFANNYGIFERVFVLFLFKKNTDQQTMSKHTKYPACIIVIKPLHKCIYTVREKARSVSAFFDPIKGRIGAVYLEPLLVKYILCYSYFVRTSNNF